MAFGTPIQAVRDFDRRSPEVLGVDPLKVRRAGQEIQEVREALDGLASEEFVQETVAPLARSDATAEAIAGVMSAMPRPATSTPLPETTGGAAGSNTTEYSLGPHQHPRLTSATGPHILDSTGRASVVFTRSFDRPPVLTLQHMADAATKERPVVFQATYVMAGGAVCGSCRDRTAVATAAHAFAAERDRASDPTGDGRERHRIDAHRVRRVRRLGGGREVHVPGGPLVRVAVHSGGQVMSRAWPHGTNLHT